MARGRPTAAFVADLSQHTFAGELQTQQEIDLRVPANTLSRLDELSAGYSARLPYDEVTLSPRSVRIDDGHVVATLGLSSYSRFLASVDVFGELSMGSQRQEFVRHSIGTPPWFAHSLGVNCTLETADHKLIWAMRGPVPVEPGLVTPVMGEGARFDDIIDGMWHPETTARRGFHEELGFPLDSRDVLDITFHSLIAQFGNGGHSVTAHAITTLSLQDVLVQHQDAVDNDEHPYGFFVCETEPASLEAFIDAHPLDEWTSWGTANLWNLAKYYLDTTIDGLELQPIDMPIYVNK